MENHKPLIFNLSQTLRNKLVDQFRSLISNIQNNGNTFSYNFPQTDDELNPLFLILDDVLFSLIQNYNIFEKLKIIREFYLNPNIINALTNFRQKIITEIFPLVKDFQSIFILDLDGYPLSPSQKKQLFGDLIDDPDLEKAKTILCDPDTFLDQNNSVFRSPEIIEQYSKFTSVVNLAILLNDLIQLGNEFDSRIEAINKKEEEERKKFCPQPPKIDLSINPPPLKRKQSIPSTTETTQNDSITNEISTLENEALQKNSINNQTPPIENETIEKDSITNETSTLENETLQNNSTTNQTPPIENETIEKDSITNETSTLENETPNPTIETPTTLQNVSITNETPNPTNETLDNQNTETEQPSEEKPKKRRRRKIHSEETSTVNNQEQPIPNQEQQIQSQHHDGTTHHRESHHHHEASQKQEKSKSSSSDIRSLKGEIIHIKKEIAELRQQFNDFKRYCEEMHKKIIQLESKTHQNTFINHVDTVKTAAYVGQAAHVENANQVRSDQPNIPQTENQPTPPVDKVRKHSPKKSAKKKKTKKKEKAQKNPKIESPPISPFDEPFDEELPWPEKICLFSSRIPDKISLGALICIFFCILIKGLLDVELRCEKYT